MVLSLPTRCPLALYIFSFPTPSSVHLATFLCGKTMHLADWKLGHPFSIKTGSVDRMDWNIAHQHWQCVISHKSRDFRRQIMKAKEEIIRTRGKYEQNVCKGVYVCTSMKIQLPVSQLTLMRPRGLNHWAWHWQWVTECPLFLFLLLELFQSSSCSALHLHFPHFSKYLSSELSLPLI